MTENTPVISGLYLPKAIGWPALILLGGWITTGIGLYFDMRNNVGSLERRLAALEVQNAALSRIENRLGRIEGQMEIMIGRRAEPPYVSGSQ